MFTFQLCDDQGDSDGHIIDLATLKIARHCPVLFDHSQEKVIGRVVKVWRDGGRILGAVEFAATASGQCSEWATRQGGLSHVSPLFLYPDQPAGPIQGAVMVEVTLTSVDGEPKSIRNVLVSKPAGQFQKPSPMVWARANLFVDDLNAWLQEQPVQAEGVAIDARPHVWTDPVLA